MPNVAQVLKEEITRLARKEVRGSFDPLREQVRLLRKTVRAQQTTINRQERSLAKIVEQSGATTGANLLAPEAQTQAEGSRARITAASIRRHRHRLGLSQAQLGELVSVSTNSIVRWEQGSSRPRAQYRAALLRLRDLGVKDVRRMLVD